MGLIELIKRASAWVSGYSGSTPELPDVDKQYLQSDAVQYRYVTVAPETAAEVDGASTIRCDLCGAVRTLDEAPSLFAHVGAHHEEGGAEIDPFETDPGAKTWRLGMSGEAEPWEI